MSAHQVAFFQIPKVRPLVRYFRWSGEVGVSTDGRVFYDLDRGGCHAFSEAKAAGYTIVEHVGAYFVDIDWLVATAAKPSHAVYFTAIKGAALEKFDLLTEGAYPAVAKKKPTAPRITVAWELANRRGCNVGLAGLTVEYKGRNYVVESSAWVTPKRRVVRLVDGPAVSPGDLILVSVWRKYCCQPSKWHSLNLATKHGFDRPAPKR